MKDALSQNVPPEQAWNAFAARFGQPMPLAPNLSAVLSQSGPPPSDAPLFSADLSDPETGTRHTAHLHLAGFPFKAAAGVDLTLDALGALSEGFRRDILAGALTFLRDALPVARLCSLPAPAKAAPEGLTWTAADIDGGWGETARVLVGAPAADWQRLAERLLAAGLTGSAGAELGRQIAAQIPVRGRFSAAHLTLDAAALAALEPGDMLVPAPPDVFPRFEGRGFAVTLAPVEGAWTIKEIELNDTDSQSAAVAEPDIPAADIMDVPVTLSIVTGERQIALSDLAGLAPGGVLPLDPPDSAPGAPVRLVANGRTVGKGHLVQVDGALAVRVSDIFGKG